MAGVVLSRNGEHNVHAVFQNRLGKYTKVLCRNYIWRLNLQLPIILQNLTQLDTILMTRWPL